MSCLQCSLAFAVAYLWLGEPAKSHNLLYNLFKAQLQKLLYALNASKAIRLSIITCIPLNQQNVHCFKLLLIDSCLMVSKVHPFIRLRCIATYLLQERHSNFSGRMPALNGSDKCKQDLPNCPQHISTSIRGPDEKIQKLKLNTYLWQILASFNRYFL